MTEPTYVVDFGPVEHLGKRAQHLYSEILAAQEPAAHEAELLIEVCGQLDVCEQLEQLIQDEGFTTTGSRGKIIHPAVPELRQARAAFSRLVKDLRIPLDDEEAAEADRRRTTAAHKAADARWQRQGTK